MTPSLLLVFYCVLILAASLLGGWIPLLVRLTHRRMELLVSFVSGVILGVAVLHLLPHALVEVVLGLLGIPDDGERRPTLSGLHPPRECQRDRDQCKAEERYRNKATVEPLQSCLFSQLDIAAGSKDLIPSVIVIKLLDLLRLLCWLR